MPGDRDGVLAGGYVPKFDRAVPSAEARALPSQLNAADVIALACPPKVAVFLPVAMSQSLIVWSQLPEAKVLPSGLNATAVT